MKMTKEYNPDSEKRYAAPEAPQIIEPEPMISEGIKHPSGLIKYPILFLTCAYFLFNTANFFMVTDYRSIKMSKSEIEEKVDKDYGNEGGLIKFLMDDFSKQGRELAYLIHGDGEQEK